MVCSKSFDPRQASPQRLTLSHFHFVGANRCVKCGAMNITNIAPHGTPFEASGATKIIEASGADGNTHQRVSSEFEQLQRLAQPSRLQIRAEIVSRFKQGESINSISNAMHCSKKTVQRWVRRYRQAGDKNMAESVLNMADVLKDAPRSGRPSKRTPFLRNLVDGLVCLSPDNLVTHGLFGPLKLEFACAQRWTYRMLAKATTLSVGTTYNYVKSWGVRLEVSQSTYCFSTDPQFFSKALLLHLLYTHGEQLGYKVMCFDEAPCWQATSHQEMGMDCSGQVKSSDRYVRHGFIHVLGFLHPQSGHLNMYYEEAKDASVLISVFKEQLDFLDNSGQKIVMILDNLSAHARLQQEIEAQYPNVKFVYTPTNASWLNLIENGFAITKRALPRGRIWHDVDELITELKSVVSRHNSLCEPYKWDYNITKHFNQLFTSTANIRATCNIDPQDLQDVACDVLAPTFKETISSMVTRSHSETFSDASLLAQSEIINSEQAIEFLHRNSAPAAQSVTPAPLHASSEAAREALGLDSAPQHSFLRQDVIDAINDAEKARPIIERMLMQDRRPYRAPYKPKPNQVVERLDRMLDQQKQKLANLEQSNPDEPQDAAPKRQKSIAAVKKRIAELEIQLADARSTMQQKLIEFKEKMAALQEYLITTLCSQMALCRLPPSYFPSDYDLESLALSVSETVV